MAQSKYEERLIELDRQAVEEGYKETIKHLFEAFMRTRITHPHEPTMVGKGALVARKAYTDAMNAIEAREKRQ